MKRRNFVAGLVALPLSASAFKLKTDDIMEDAIDDICYLLNKYIIACEDNAQLEKIIHSLTESFGIKHGLKISTAHITVNSLDEMRAADIIVINTTGYDEYLDLEKYQERQSWWLKNVSNKISRIIYTNNKGIREDRIIS